jgi:hypothetical protein
MGTHKKVEYCGKTYDSIKALAETYNLSSDAVRLRLKNNIPLELPKNQTKPITLDGKTYSSLKEASKELGLSCESIRLRIRTSRPLTRKINRPQSNQFMDLTGHIFGKLTVIKRIPNLKTIAGMRNSDRSPKWLCRCECGRESTPTTRNLVSSKKPARQCGSCGAKLIKHPFGKIKRAELCSHEKLAANMKLYPNIYILKEKLSISLNTIERLIADYRLNKPKGFYTKVKNDNN